MVFLEASLANQVRKLKILSKNHDHHRPRPQILMTHTHTIHMLTQLHAYTQPESNYAQQGSLERVLMVPENSTYK